MRRKKRFSRVSAWVAIVLIPAAIGGYMYYTSRLVSLTFYPEFGIAIPTDYPVHGIDISRYQGRIDWNQVHQMVVDSVQISFVFIKATEGTNRQDDHFLKNWREAKSAGLIRGAYHFFYSTRDPLRQAKNFEELVDLRPGDLPPVLDVEVSNDQPDSTIRASALVWLTEIQAHYGVEPIIYTNPRFYETHLGAAFDGFPLWVSHFYLNRLPSAGRKWTFWQHSESGHVNGIAAPVDFNVFNGDSLALRKLCLP